MKAKISIIMPIYNSEQYLEKAINTVLNQSFSDFELILVDDGSSDHSGEICDNYSKSDSRVVVIHKENGGICSARNTGMSAAQGEYIMFMDNDDALDIDTMKDNYELMQKHQADWIKFGKMEILIQKGNVLKSRATCFVEKEYNDKQILGNLLSLKKQDIMTFVWDSLFKRNIIIENGIIFDAEFKQGNEDIDFCEQYAKYAKRLFVNSKCYYTHYTRIGVSASSKYSRQKIDSYIYLLRKCNARYKDYKIDINECKEDYVYIITKQIVANICEKLNYAGNQLTAKEKCNIMKEIKASPEFSMFNALKKINTKEFSKKIYIYYWLFSNGKYRLLLWFDKYSRKIVYLIRKFKGLLFGKRRKGSFAE